MSHLRRRPSQLEQQLMKPSSLSQRKIDNVASLNSLDNQGYFVTENQILLNEKTNNATNITQEQLSITPSHSLIESMNSFQVWPQDGTSQLMSDQPVAQRNYICGCGGIGRTAFC